MYLTNLKRHRLLAGLTQEELANAVGMHRATIIKLERGEHPARPRTLKKLADALGVRTRDLVELPEIGSARVPDSPTQTDGSPGGTSQ